MTGLRHKAQSKILFFSPPIKDAGSSSRTGTIAHGYVEEYFNSGWCSFDRKAVSGFIKTHPGEVALYSFHLNDAFQFRRNIRVAEETLGMDGAGMIGDTIIRRDHPLWGSVAFWYALPIQPARSTAGIVTPR